MFDTWRARKALKTRTAPSTVDEAPHPQLVEVVEALRLPLGAPHSLGDPTWHLRWEGELHLVGLDAVTRSTADVRQRLTRLVHENELRHLPRRGKRVVAVVRCDPAGADGIDGWYAKLQTDHGEVGPADWRAARRHCAIVALTPDGRSRLFGGDRVVRDAVDVWQRGAGAIGEG